MAGGKVVLSEGAFAFAAAVTPVSNLIVEGQGKGSTGGTRCTLGNGLDTYMFLKEGTVTNFTLRNLALDADKANQASGGCVYIWTPQHCHFDGVEIKNGKDYGLLLGKTAETAGFQNIINGWTLLDFCGVGARFINCDENQLFNALIGNSDTYGTEHLSGRDLVQASVYIGNQRGIRATDCGALRILANVFDSQDYEALYLWNSSDNMVGFNNFYVSSQDGAGNYDDIYNGWTGYRNLFGFNTFESPNAKYNLETDASGQGANRFDGTRIGFNSFRQQTTGKLSLANWGVDDYQVFANPGYVTENRGTATLVNGQVAIVVNHGLDVTPVAGDIMVTPIEGWGAMTEFYIDTYTSTQFTIHVDQNPGQDVDFAWKAEVL